MNRKINGEYSREFKFDTSSIDIESRTVEVSFSSETTEVVRSFGVEVLSHDPQSVRLDRLNGGGAVLVNHNTDDQVGVVVEARIDQDRIGRAKLRFSKSARGQEIFDDIVDGIRTLTSVQYSVIDWSVQSRSDGPDIVTITDWEPTEVSIVSIPADSAVGVGRSSEAKQKIKPVQEERVMTEDVKEKAKIEAPDIGKIQATTRKEEMARINQIREMAETHNLEDLGREAISEGLKYEDFNKRALEAIGERNSKARIETKHDGNVDLTGKEARQFSFVKLMDAIADPNNRRAQERAAFELEVGQAATEGFGSNFNVRGAYVPDAVLTRTLSAGTATDGAELVGTSLLAGSFVDVLRNSMATANAGVTTLSGLVGNVDIPRQTTGSTMGWISAEDGDAPNSEAQFDQISMSPKDAAIYTEVTRRLTQQSTPAIEMLIRNDLARGIGIGTDLAVLYGSGASGQPTGIANTSGINTFNFSAADPTYAEIIRMVKEVMVDNALTGTPQFIIDPNGWEALTLTPKQGSGVEGNFILNGNTIAGYGYQSTNQVVAEDYFFGDFSQAIVGEWGGLELNVDPYTNSLKGRIRFVVFKTMDVAVRQAVAFCHCNDGV